MTESKAPEKWTGDKKAELYKDTIAFLIDDLRTVAEFKTLGDRAALRLCKAQLDKVEIILTAALQRTGDRPP